MNPPFTLYGGRFALLWHAVGSEASFDNPAEITSSPQFSDLAGPKSASEITEVAQSPAVGSHWDLMIELDGGQLLTWRIGQLPRHSDGTYIEISALRLPDHRQIYLTYEGPISGDRGRVKQFAAGSYRALFTSGVLESRQQYHKLLNCSEPANGGSCPLLPQPTLEQLGAEEHHLANPCDQSNASDRKQRGICLIATLRSPTLVFDFHIQLGQVDEPATFTIFRFQWTQVPS